MSDEMEQMANLPTPTPSDSCPESLISLSPVLSKVYSHAMIKSLNNILSMDIVQSKASHKKSNKIRRSATLKDVSGFKYSRWSGTNLSYEQIQEAQSKVNDAIQKGKVFTVLGPYRRIREVLRNRGWVEKFYLNNDVITNSSHRKSRSSFKYNGDKIMAFDDGDDGDDNGDDGDDDYIDGDNDDVDDSTLGGLPPWEEDDGIYGVMSRMLKKVQPNLFWTLRKGQVDYKNLRKDQIINHHGKAGNFTTKTGLAKCLNQLRWFDDKEPDEFFPRCFIISTVEEKNAFIDDFHFTACTSLIKEIIADSRESDVLMDISNNSKISDTVTCKSNKKILPKINYCAKKKERNGYINYKFLEMAIAYCEFILRIKSHEDIDRDEFIFCWSCNWDEFLNNYYKVVHNGYRVEGANNEETHKRCIEIAKELRKKFPQFDMEGSRNVWILKPGAKSRGRGIMCYSRLNDVLKLLTHSFVANENKFIVQKYIERPLLICNTKFDIRQWFMVTDWNPLTVWWYKDCYLRFCSQQYTLDDFNEAVHLSNNSIQHKYHNGPRSELLPTENMWDSKQFENWMKNEGYGDTYDTIIQPGMKDAVIDVLLCVQDTVECRKNTFELYGADFMVSENDLKPWLIEINSSPCLSPSTQITARLTSAVLEDIFKVILDRKENRQCDTGRFELFYKQNAIFVPPYVGIDLKLSGTSIKNPIIPTILTERRLITKPAVDSVLIRQCKLKEVRAFDQRSVEDSVVVNTSNVTIDSIAKFEDKLDATNTRSTATISLNSSQAQLSTNQNKLSVSNLNPQTAIFKTSIISPASNIKGRKTSSNSIIELSNIPLFVQKSKRSNNDVHPYSSMDSDSAVVSKPSESSYLSTLADNGKFPFVMEIKHDSKSTANKFDYPYKLPSKAEVVNFAAAKPMLNISTKVCNLKKRPINNKPIKRTSNTQMFLQSFAMAKPNSSCDSYYKSMNKGIKLNRELSVISELGIKAYIPSKNQISTKLCQRAPTFLLKRGENNNHITLVDYTFSVGY